MTRIAGFFVGLLGGLVAGTLLGWLTFWAIQCLSYSGCLP